MIAVDTSVLVASLVSAHPDHELATRALERYSSNGLSVCVHGLAEAFAILTRLPVRPRISAESARVLVVSAVAGWRIVTLEPALYERAMLLVQGCERSGGAVYDALHVAAAEAVAADGIATFNREDFVVLWSPEKVLDPAVA